MKIISYLNDGKMSVGIVQNNTVFDVSDHFPDVLSIIKAGPKGMDEINRMLKLDVERKPLKSEHLLSPIPKLERNVMCVGWNYLEHFKERFRQDIELPARPTVFTKATEVVAGPYEEIPLSNEFTEKFDYEAELAVVIGRKGKNISEAEASDYIFGYMCANDLSARDVQQAHGGQWFMGKSMDKSCPMGPWLVTKDGIEDVQNLEVTCKVNGNKVQSSNTNLMMFSVNRIIAELSKGMTLLPGDIILTGTPSGIGAKRNPPLFLGAGDVVEVSISGIGSIKNGIVKVDESIKLEV
ncbi:fumarylacetoacetate hydrolase family protein [Bacillus benzoevorans]|uniref:2-keto-4-pentenoate hydratase/2-oxohepta-3-ene-1,7-dioic acid hydratase in catechol pathway n=1 Tax=Bacillus benzoevorans TaxID=1456 RepID=A0A7X0HSV1_9BACI|nr:fumarylacetoacetate hydrolase family protein [Bacillus benzoevorans]MBB6446220.1 2-keto-4-pentenoate hydratase/2-oxohepta-3-ene-1,7-dioic acid hydratase in catechol pathway [Bacillus benzoevorans]